MSSQKHDTAAKKRILEVLRTLIESPSFYTKKKLAEIYNVNPDTISRDFEDLRNAGFALTQDNNYRYSIAAEKISEQIKDLILISDKEKKLISDALQDIPVLEKNRIISKLETLSNIPRLGNVIFTKPYLAKVNLLKKACDDKQKVVLSNYKSTNSNSHSDRIVEPFHIVPEDDILHAFDLDRNDIRHFRLSRIDSVLQLDDDWEHEGKHYVAATDIFKITNKEQVKIHIRLKTGGYNELIERYPIAKAYLSPSPHNPGTYDLECLVNRKFFGLQNFLLGYHEYVDEIIENDELRSHMKDLKQKLNY